MALGDGALAARGGDLSGGADGSRIVTAARADRSAIPAPQPPPPTDPA